MYTFPGGVYEESDKNLKITAIREIFEEAGAVLYPYNHQKNDKKDEKINVIEWREKIRLNPSKFHDFLSLLNLSIQSNNLHHFCTFVTPNFEKRKYTTIFFITEINENNSNNLEADGTETSSLKWMDPLQALELNKQKEMIFLPPQFYILKELSDYSSIEMIFSQLLGKNYLTGITDSTTTSNSGNINININRKIEEDDSNKYLPENVYNLIDDRGFPPYKPNPLLSSASQMILTLPFDESHPDYPGKEGQFHRIHCTLPMGHGGYQLEKTI